MSTPRSLTREPGVTIDTLMTSRGTRAALVAGVGTSARGTVVLVPGFTGSKEDFMSLLPHLARAGWASVTYDQLGQYESPASDSEADYALDLLAADLIDIAGSLTGPLHVVGHSFGGLVVATAVIKRPEIFASVTVLACGLGPLSEPLASETAPFLLIPDETPAATVWQLRREIEGPLDPNLPPEVAAFVERKFVASPVVAMKAKLRALLTAPDLSAALAATARPFLVATGATDDYWALDRQRAVAAALGTELVLFAGCGHSPAVDDPAQVAAEFDQFWTSSHS